MIAMPVTDVRIVPTAPRGPVTFSELARDWSGRHADRHLLCEVLEARALLLEEERPDARALYLCDLIEAAILERGGGSPARLEVTITG